MSLRSMTQGGGGGESASIFVTGLSEADIVTATKEGKTVKGKWVTEERLVERKIPTMTSNTSPSGVASASSFWDESYAPYRAFFTEWSGWSPSGSDSFGNAYVQYEFEQPIVPTKIGIANMKSSVDAYFTYTVKASSDLDTWDTLIDHFYLSERDVFIYNEVNAEKSYRYFRLVLMGVSSGGQLTSSFGHKMQVHGVRLEEVSGHDITKIKDYGLWTVTATNGEKTTTQDVLVDAAVEFEIEMSYFTYLYREGDECEDLTGGWQSVALALVNNTNAVAPTVTRNDDNIVVYMGAQGGGIFCCANKIDLTSVEKLYFTGRFEIAANMSTSYLTLCAWSSLGSISTQNVTTLLDLWNMGYTDGEAKNVNLENEEVDVSGLSGEYVIGFSYYGQNGSNYGQYVRSTMYELKMQ